MGCRARPDQLRDQLSAFSFSSADDTSVYSNAYWMHPERRGAASQQARLAWERLRNVLDLAVSGPAAASAGGNVPLAVTVTNSGSGHNFPTGFPEGRIAWLALQIAFVASPIGFIITLIVGLVAAIIYAWTHFEGFRAVVIDVWHAIQAAAVAVYNGFLKPIFDAIVTAARAVATGLVAAWHGIEAAIQIPATVGVGVKEFVLAFVGFEVVHADAGQADGDAAGE